MSYGYTGKVLRVNLTTKEITTEPVDKYKPYIGGCGLGFKVMFDEVPPGIHAHDSENKIIFGVGPMTGSGVPCSGITTVTSLMAFMPHSLLGYGSMGGRFGSQLKYAGWDSIIVEGVSETPVYIAIRDDKVTIENASHMWGKGVYNANAVICAEMGKEASVAAIGQAGETLKPYSSILNDISHSAGGSGSVMGSKKLKAVAVIGTGPVKLKNSREMLVLHEFMRKQLINVNNSVVPRTPQPWSDYAYGSSGWRGRDGSFLGEADKINDSDCCETDKSDMIGFRAPKALRDGGALAEKYAVRMGGCSSCPVSCHVKYSIPNIKTEFGVSQFISSPRDGWSAQGMMPAGVKDTFDEGDRYIIPKSIVQMYADDYGLWSNQGMLSLDIQYAYDNDLFKKNLSEDEYNSIPWHLAKEQNLRFLRPFMTAMCCSTGELSHILDGSWHLAKRWGYGGDFWNSYRVSWSMLGYPKHHGVSCSQVSALINSVFNRDAQNHVFQNLRNSGLPHEYQKRVVEELYAVGDSSALDTPTLHTPMNICKAKFAKFCNERHIVHSALTLCGWVWPLFASPDQSGDYRGDTALEAKYLTAITGEEYTEEGLDQCGERIINILRAYTCLQMKTNDLFNKHDYGQISDWVFEPKAGQAYFTEGCLAYDREDMKRAFEMYYEVCGWDKDLGCPTRSKLEELELHDVADRLAEAGLLP